MAFGDLVDKIWKKKKTIEFSWMTFGVRIQSYTK